MNYDYGSPNLPMIDLSAAEDSVSEYLAYQDFMANVPVEEPEQFLTFNVVDDQPILPLMTITSQNQAPNTLTIYSDGKEYVSVDLRSGDVSFGPDYVPTEAARLFWQAIGQTQSSAASQLAKVQDVLNRTAEALGVRNGELIVDTAKARMDHIEWLRRRNDELGLQLRILANEPGDQLVKDLTNDPNDMVLGYKGKTVLGEPEIHCPYIPTNLPVQKTPALDFDEVMKPFKQDLL